MIFYFTGTGNSQLVAKKIGLACQDQVVSINEYMKTGRVGNFQSEKPLVFVVPTYAWRLPRLVEAWIIQTEFKGNNSAYFILTCGDSCGNAQHYARKLCQLKDFKFRGLEPVIMPENYIAMFTTPEPEVAETIIKKAEPQISRLSVFIKQDIPFTSKPSRLLGKVQSKLVNPIFYKMIVKDTEFKVDDKCNSCGQCALQCPINNIKLVNGRPTWGGVCTHCMACISVCPSLAIDYGNVSKGKPRYFIKTEG